MEGLKQSERLGYLNCKWRTVKRINNPMGKVRYVGKCKKDGRYCGEDYMQERDCYEIREEDEVVS